MFLIVAILSSSFSPSFSGTSRRSPRSIVVEVIRDWGKISDTDPQPGSTDTLIIRTAPGRSIARPGADSPFTLLSIVDEDHAWVRSTMMPVAHHFQAGLLSLGLDERRLADSVLISTVPRNFNDDAGQVITDWADEYSLRIVSSSKRRESAPERRLTIDVRARQDDYSPFALAVRSSRLVALGRIVSILHLDRRRSGAAIEGAEIRFMPIDEWKGHLAREEPLSVWSFTRVTTDSSWAANATTAPLQAGQRVVFFLRRNDPSMWIPAASTDTVWTLTPGGGYAEIAPVEELVFSPWSRGVPLRDFAAWVRSRTREPLPNHGAVIGHLIRAGSGPLVGARVAIPREGLETISDSTGWFEFPSVRVGAYRLEVRRGRGAPSEGIVGVSDEYTDSLRVLVP